MGCAHILVGKRLHGLFMPTQHPGRCANINIQPLEIRSMLVPSKLTSCTCYDVYDIAQRRYEKTELSHKREDHPADKRARSKRPADQNTPRHLSLA